MPTHYSDVSAINLSADNALRGLDICFERAAHPPAKDVQVEKLKADFEETLLNLKEMSASDAVFSDVFNGLLVGAQVGVMGPDFNVAAGRAQLNAMRLRMVEAARASRDVYLRQLAAWSGGLAAVSILSALAIDVVDPQHLPDGPLLNHYAMWRGLLAPVCWLNLGVALGVVFTAYSINRQMTYERVNAIDPYFFSPGMRLLYTCVVAYVLLAALWFKVVQIGVGGLLLNEVRTRPGIGLLVGLICGVAEALIVRLLQEKLKPESRKTKA